MPTRRCATRSPAAATACSPSASDDDEDIYHLSRRSFRLNGRIHELVLLRQLTAELRRQEVQTWKKVIRVISHELNNSLAPIASLAHSGAELLRRGQHERLPSALATIEERARHLEGFIRDYARFAKLPAPRLEPVEWQRFVAQLRTQVEFVAEVQPADGIARVDAGAAGTGAAQPAQERARIRHRRRRRCGCRCAASPMAGASRCWTAAAA